MFYSHTFCMDNSKWKKCAFCGRFFRPDSRVGDRQKSCKDLHCQQKRRWSQQRAWRAKNPDYFKGRYGYLKEWRMAHPDYQRARRRQLRGEIQTQIPPVSPIKSMRIHLRVPMRFYEIQTQILTVTLAGEAFWIDGAPMQGP